MPRDYGVCRKAASTTSYSHTALEHRSSIDEGQQYSIQRFLNCYRRRVRNSQSIKGQSSNEMRLVEKMVKRYQRRDGWVLLARI